jgi:hypothetical protein
MSVSGISSSSFFAGLNSTAVQNKFKQVQQDFQQLGQDLQFGNLCNAIFPPFNNASPPAERHGPCANGFSGRQSRWAAVGCTSRRNEKRCKAATRISHCHRLAS